MSRDTLFGHLADRFVVQRENLATEALAYILSRSQPARLALGQLLSLGGVVIPESLSFRTQAAGEDHAIPDLVGENEQGQQVLIMEAKFWAGLTDAQPVDYLRRLEAESRTALVFIAPQQRIEVLWRELVDRCQQAGIACTASPQSFPDVRLARVAHAQYLAVVSWRTLLHTLQLAVEADTDQSTSSDIQQLQGLCDRMDAEAFLPLTSEELTGHLGRRIVQFGHFVDDLTRSLVAEGQASTKGLRAAAGNGWYGRYLVLHGVGCLLYVSAHKWGTLAYTPLWLLVRGPNWKPDPRVGEALRSMSRTDAR